MGNSQKIGDPVVWVIRDRVTGDPLRTVASFIRAFEKVRQSDGSDKMCAVLACNRLAPVDDLYDPDETPEIAKKPTEPRASSVTKPHESSQSASVARSTPVQSSSRGEVAPRTTDKPAPSVSECRVLAIDFLNVLVRAWHAGAPSESHAVRSLFQTTANAIRTLNPVHVVFAMDGGHKKRTELFAAYKAHRPESDPNLQAQKKLAESALRICGFQTIRVIDWEADDVLASLAMAYDGTVIVSSDKDLLCLTAKANFCRIYHPWGSGKFVTANDVLNIDAHLVTDYLALCGDKTDGIPGVRGIGEKTAVQLLGEFKSLEGILSAAVQGKIKGAKGTQLSEQRSMAILSRDLIELNDRLSLPSMESFRPVAGWQQRLQEQRLGSVAAIVHALQGQKCLDFCGGLLANELSPVVEPCREQQDVASVISQPDRSPPCPAEARTESDCESLSIDVETLLSMSSAADWSTPKASAITTWHAGRLNSRGPNPWRPGTWHHAVWSQGASGIPLHTQFIGSSLAPSSSSSVGSDVPNPAAKRVQKASLFE